MTTTCIHSVDDPPKPSTWRIVWDLHDPEIYTWCPNGHKMKILGRQWNIDVALVHSCNFCDFKDLVYLVSN